MRHLLPFLACFFFVSAVAQNKIKEYVIANTAEIKSIDPDSSDYSDLEKFGQAIGDKRIVLLGEQSHGDAATFLAKSRLIKYLHEKKGFNVLAFESDFFSINNGWDKLEKSRLEIDSFIKGNIFPIWTYCHTCENLFYKYIYTTQSTKSPLQIAGIDNQLHGDYGYKNHGLKNYLNQSFTSANLPESLLPFTDTVLKYADSLFVYVKLKNINGYDEFETAAKKFLDFYSPNKEIYIVIQSLIAAAKEKKAYAVQNRAAYYLRDEQMANNIKWLLFNKYSNEKIIVWAHNAHVSKNSGNIFDPGTNENRMMGSFLYADPMIKNMMYVLGVTSYSGYNDWTTSKKLDIKIPAPKRNSFENWVNKDFQFSFTDFAGYNINNPAGLEKFNMKGALINQHRNQSLAWTKIFDGILFIREMYGCKENTLR